MRLKALDILRALAILLVLGRHYDIFEPWHRGGWSGVDLFFVLSGFLISGLLFSEYIKTGQIRIGRFLIRRGFKIYPPYYFFLGWTAAMFVFYHGTVPFRSMVPELLFLQSYLPGRWPHTWSLAVEEHFYLLLPIVLMLLCRFSRDRKDPFQALTWLFAAVAVTNLGLRYSLGIANPAEALVNQGTTHMNIDSLLFGVLLSYFYHFRRAWFDRLARLPDSLLLTGSILLVAPCFFLNAEDTPFIQTLGHPMLYIGYGGLLVFAIKERRNLRIAAPVEAAGDLLAFLGRYSYSIYLWHYAVSIWGLELLRRKSLLPEAHGLQFLIYAGLSFAVGIGMARLVEFPSLKIRDRFFPSRGDAVVVPPHRETAALPSPAQVTEAV